jgi:alanine racemase
MEGNLVAEISASAVTANLALLRSCLAPGVKLCAVVKADCYGHGLRTLLGAISQDADVLAVATAEEAVALRDLGYHRPILMIFAVSACGSGKALREALAELIARQVTLTVAASEEVEAVEEAARRLGGRGDVHVKIDSGMNRSGSPAGEAPALVQKLRRCPNVKLTGLYTHFASADEADKTSALEQLRTFLAAVESCGGRSGLTLHAAASSGLIDLPQTHLDMVRPGIAVYGYQPSDRMHRCLPLRPVMRLWGRLMQVKDVPAGARCGYGLTYTFQRPSRIALAPIGYADGYLRCLSNQAAMRVGGRDVPVRGRVSMDQVILDVTDSPGVKVGDPVEIISNDPSAPHSVENLARLCGTIPYEITCRLGSRVRRVLVD